MEIRVPVVALRVLVTAMVPVLSLTPSASLAGGTKEPGPATERPKSPSTVRGNVTASLAPVVFGETDGLPDVLVPGREYVALLHIWVTPDAVHPRAEFDVPGGHATSCRHLPLEGGVIRRVSCTFVAGVTHPRVRPGIVALTVRVKLARGGGYYTRTYEHRLSR